MDKGQKLRAIPAMDIILGLEWVQSWLESLGRMRVKRIITRELSEIRRSILEDDGEFSPDDFRDSCLNAFASASRPLLRRVVNATGVVIHTNLGRSLIAGEAVSAMSEIAGSYSNLEYDLKAGARGQRNSHVEDLLCALTGAESSFVVNNNAGAVMLALSALAKDSEVIVSRGELVEIGGSFRIPDIMELSGATLHEVGTTNRTHLYDYERAINEESTKMLMKIHPSNFRIEGFTSSPERKELSRLAKDNGLIFMEDAGSGLLVDGEIIGLSSNSGEISIRECIESGADIVTFSGDKILGGPQIGGIAGKKKYIDRLKKYPLARALRCDKVTLAGFEATLRLYAQGKYDSIPTLRMIRRNVDGMKTQAESLAESLREKVKAEIRVVETEDATGGGSCPEIKLRGYGVAVKHETYGAGYIQKLLRGLDVPILCGARENEIVIHVRTLQDCDIDIIPASLAGVLNA